MPAIGLYALTTTMCEAKKNVSFIANTFKSAWMIDAQMVTCPFKRTFINVCNLKRMLYYFTFFGGDINELGKLN